MANWLPKQPNSEKMEDKIDNVKSGIAKAAECVNIFIQLEIFRQPSKYKMKVFAFLQFGIMAPAYIVKF